MTCIPETHTCSKILLHISKKNLPPIFLKYTGKGHLREENSSLFTHLDSINEEEEELGSLGGENETDKLQLNRYIEVLQIKRKEMDSGKKSSDLLSLAANELVWLMDAPSAEKNHLVPKAQAPLDKPLLSTPALAEPTPQVRYTAPIESKVKASDIISWVLS